MSLKQVAIGLLCFWLSIPMASAQSSAQEAFVSKKFSSTPLVEVLSWVESHFNYRIAYNPDLIKGIYVNDQMEARMIPQQLSALLAPHQLLVQQIGDDRIVIGPMPKEQTEKDESLTIQIKGRVIEHSTGMPLPGAVLFIEAIKKGCTSDEDGYFSLVVPASHLPIMMEARYLGYGSQLVEIKAPGAPYTVALQQAPLAISPILIEEEIPTLSLRDEQTVIDFSNDLLGGLSSIGGQPDIFRQIQLLPGVAAFDDLSTGIQVRGSNIDENMVLLDGMPLYQVGHYYGVFSAIPPAIVDHVVLHKNIFPIEHNGRTASVLEINTDSLNLGTWQTILEGDRFLGSGAFWVPLTKKAELTFSVRHTLQNIGQTSIAQTLDDNEALSRQRTEADKNFNRTNLFSVQPAVQFSDYYTKFQWRINDQSWLRATGYLGSDQLETNYLNTFSVFENAQQSLEESLQETTSWRNRALGLTYINNWNPTWSTIIKGSASYFEVDSDENFGLLTYDQRRPIVSSKEIAEVSLLQQNDVNTQQLIAKQTWQQHPNWALQFGYSFHREASEVFLQNTIQSRSDKFQYDGNGMRHQGFIEADWTPLDQWTIKSGYNLAWYSGDQNWHHSPRLLLQFEPSAHALIKGAWSRYNQFVRQINHENYFGENRQYWLLANGEDVPVANTNHLMLGASWKKKGWLLDVEAYEKRTDGVLDYVLLNPGFTEKQSGTQPRNDFRLFFGTGRVIGVDFLLRKDWKDYTSWISYTLSKSTNQFDEINKGQPYSSQNDRRHQLKWVNAYQYKNWQFSMDYIFASGRPYLDLAQVNEGFQSRNFLPLSDRLNRLPDYHRMDIGLRYDWTIKSKVNLEIGLSIFNVFNRQNVKYRQFIYAIEPPINKRDRLNSSVIGTDFGLLDRQLNFNVRLKF